MKLPLIIAALGLALATPASAELSPGTPAPDFAAPAYLAGQAFTFNLAAALKKGPVVVYFFPAVHSAGCNIEAHLFSRSIDEFTKLHTTVIGVTAGNLKELANFSQETEHCGGRFPVAADLGAKIARQYDAILAVNPHWASRTSYVVTQQGKIYSVYSTLDPTSHVEHTLNAVRTLRP
jgi:peroxiredoxin